ncbi:MAG: NADPH-dependent oxidoreductase [Aeromicrobium sp.]|nr:NADPH-dependent oxidoreductase [Aeromicrobium sp.]
MNVSVVVGNPKARSRTWDAAHRIAQGLGAGSVTSIDVADLGPGLLDWGDVTVSRAVETVRASDVAIIASPTFKATYSGLLKLFLDRFDTGTGLEGVVAVPLMLGAGPAHQLAAEVHLKPLLVELGATVPTPALYLLDSATQPNPVERAWTERWRPAITLSVGVTP